MRLSKSLAYVLQADLVIVDQVGVCSMGSIQRGPNYDKNGYPRPLLPPHKWDGSLLEEAEFIYQYIQRTGFSRMHQSPYEMLGPWRRYYNK